MFFLTQDILYSIGFYCVYFGEKVSKCSYFVLIFIYNCGLSINYIVNLYVFYLLFRFEFAIDVIPNFFLGLCLHCLDIISYCACLITLRDSCRSLLRTLLYSMNTSGLRVSINSPQPCLSFNHISYIFVKRSFPIIFFQIWKILTLGTYWSIFLSEFV